MNSGYFGCRFTAYEGIDRATRQPHKRKNQPRRLSLALSYSGNYGTVPNFDDAGTTDTVYDWITTSSPLYQVCFKQCTGTV